MTAVKPAKRKTAAVFARAAGRVLRVAATALLILSILCALAVFGPVALGYKSVRISSSSMSPALSVGDVIYLKRVAPVSIRPGDIITFYLHNSNAVITHRVSRVDAKAGLLYTRGDRNSEDDPAPVRFSDVIGVYINYRIPGSFFPAGMR